MTTYTNPMRADPEQATARAIGWYLSEAQRALDLDPADLPLSAQITGVLQAAVRRPSAISAETYELLYLLADKPDA